MSSSPRHMARGQRVLTGIWLTFAQQYRLSLRGSQREEQGRIDGNISRLKPDGLYQDVIKDVHTTCGLGVIIPKYVKSTGDGPTVSVITVNIRDFQFGQRRLLFFSFISCMHSTCVSPVSSQCIDIFGQRSRKVRASVGRSPSHTAPFRQRIYKQDRNDSVPGWLIPFRQL